MTFFTVRRTASVVLTSVALSLLTGCSDAPVTPGELGELQSVASSCQPDTVEHHQDRVDVSGSGQRAGLSDSARAAIRTEITRVAVCGGGTYSLVLFSAGSAQTATVYESSLSLGGATENAQLRRVGPLLNEILAKIDAAYPGAVASLPAGATDVVSQLAGVAEFAAQVPESPRPITSETVFTDGIGTSGAGIVPLGADPATAAHLADTVTVPDLSNLDRLTFAGIGQVFNGQEPSTALVDTLKAFYQRLGERAGAGHVLVVTEKLNGGNA